MAFYNDTDTPAGILGDVWCSGGRFRVRGASGWVDICSTSLPNGGMLPLSGGTVTGPITGNHGLMPIDSPHMTGTAIADNHSIVTTSLMQEAVRGSIAAALAAKSVTTGGTSGGSSGGATSTSATTTYVGSGMGNKGPQGSPRTAISIGPGSDGSWPYFTETDGSRTQAKMDEVAWFISPFTWVEQLFGDYNRSGSWLYNYSLSVTSTLNVSYSYLNVSTGSPSDTPVPVNYLILGQRIPS